MKDVTPALRSHLRQEVTTLAECLTITRRDGVTHRFTSHDQPLTIAGSEYTPLVGFARSSISHSTNLDVDSFDIDSALNSDYVDRADIAGGLLDHAEVQLFWVNWQAPNEGSMRQRRGWIERVTMVEDFYSAEVQGLTQVLRHRLGRAYSPECRADLGDRRCKVGIDPKRWAPNQAYVFGDTVLGVVNPAQFFVNLTFNNTSFEVDALGTVTTAPDGWKAFGESAARWVILDQEGDATPKLGSKFAAHIDQGTPTKDTTLYQTIDLVGAGVSTSDLDTGLCRVLGRVWAASLTTESWHTVRIYALNDVNQVVSLIYNPPGRNTPNDRWVDYLWNNVLIPAGTRKLRFDLVSSKTTDKGQGTAFDGIQAAVNLPDGTAGNTDQFGGVMMKCIQAGVSGPTEPAFTNLVGDEIADGSVVWQVIDNFKDVGEVDVMPSSTLMTPVSLPQPDGWYDQGLLIWETGRNAGKSQEVKRWVGGNIEFFQRPFFEPAQGDRFVIHAGCDKRRVTCAEKFQNTVNFRGEPDVPGRDEYYRTPNAPEG